MVAGVRIPVAAGLERWLSADPALAFRWGVQALVAVVSALIAARTLTGLLFPRRKGFLDALRFWFQPDWLSFLRGEFGKDIWATCKLFVLAAGVIATGVGSLFLTTFATARLLP